MRIMIQSEQSAILLREIQAHHSLFLDSVRKDMDMAMDRVISEKLPCVLELLHCCSYSLTLPLSIILDGSTSTKAQTIQLVIVSYN